MERLYELHSSGRYDLIVVDTPPTRNAIDFLEAPDRMADFFFSLGTLYWFASQETYDVAFMVAGYMMLSSLISYVKARAEGLGVACNVGLLARPLRLLLFALPLFIFGLTENIWVFRGALYLLLVLGVETLAHRMIVIYKGAAEKDASAAADEA